MSVTSVCTTVCTSPASVSAVTLYFTYVLDVCVVSDVPVCGSLMSEGCPE